MSRIVLSDAGWHLGSLFDGSTRSSENVSSPLSDVASILGSLHEVAEVALDQRDPASAAETGELVAGWERRNREALITGYLSVPGITGIVPPSRDSFFALLTLLELAGP